MSENEPLSEPAPNIKIYDPVSDVAEKFDFYIKIVIGILVIAFVTLLIMVGTLLIDSFHFNSATYKEYSEKMEVLKETRNTNNSSLEENRKNQKIIIDQQKQILELLRKE